MVLPRRMVLDQQQFQVGLRHASFAQQRILQDGVVLAIAEARLERGQRRAPAVRNAMLDAIADVTDGAIDLAIDAGNAGPPVEPAHGIGDRDKPALAGAALPRRPSAAMQRLDLAAHGVLNTTPLDPDEPLRSPERHQAERCPAVRRRRRTVIFGHRRPTVRPVRLLQTPRIVLRKDGVDAEETDRRSVNRRHRRGGAQRACRYLAVEARVGIHRARGGRDQQRDHRAADRTGQHS